MKTVKQVQAVLLAFRLAVLMLLVVPVSALSCPKGSYEYQGECVLDLKPITADPVKPSDELPPSDKMPSWQREGVHLIDAPNMAQDDAKQDQEKLEADRQGKKAAGIR